MTMKLRVPSVRLARSETGYARRLEALDGKVVGYVDGWAHRHDDNRFTMYPLMEELHRLLQARYGVADHVWLHKPNISEPLTEAELDDLVPRVDVVVNGEGL